MGSEPPKPPGVPIIAIDGPSGSGKGTVSRQVAHQLGWHLLDSGALYRLVALAAMKRGIGLDQEGALAQLAAGLAIEFRIGPEHAEAVWLDQELATGEIRTEQVGNRASLVAAQPLVRQALLVRQRRFARAPGLVADGRDMGSVVFPEAQLKIFLIASAAERAQRRHKQLKEKGVNANLESLSLEIAERDRRDMARPISPLVASTDAVLLDSTGVPIDAVVAQVMSLARERFDHLLQRGQ
jgi:cytidylate kinase